jgi:hypothetical protein
VRILGYDLPGTALLGQRASIGCMIHSALLIASLVISVCNAALFP